LTCSSKDLKFRSGSTDFGIHSKPVLYSNSEHR